MPVISRFYGITIKMYLRQKLIKRFIDQYKMQLLEMWETQIFKVLPPVEEGVIMMTHRIIKVESLENFVIEIVFQNGIVKQYDVKQLLDEFPKFEELRKDMLYKAVQVDEGGYGVSWNDELDISAEELWENGNEKGLSHKVDISHMVGYQLSKSRNEIRMTQKELAEKTSIYQADISKIERGLSNPSIETLQRIADGLGAELKIEFLIRKE